MSTVEKCTVEGTTTRIESFDGCLKGRGITSGNGSSRGTFKMNLREMHGCGQHITVDFRLSSDPLKHWLAPRFHRGAAVLLMAFQLVARNPQIFVFLAPRGAVFPGTVQCLQ